MFDHLHANRVFMSGALPRVMPVRSPDTSYTREIIPGLLHRKDPMSRFTRVLTASALALSMALTPAVATAQSSFAGSSIGKEETTPTPAPAPAPTLEERLEKAIEDFAVRAGATIDEEAEDLAEAAIQDALDGKLSFEEDDAILDLADGQEGYVFRFEKNKEMLEELIKESEEADVSEISGVGRGGIAVGSDEDWLYLAVVEFS